MSENEPTMPPVLRASEKEKPPVLRAPAVPGPDDVWEEVPASATPDVSRVAAVEPQPLPEAVIANTLECPHCEGRGYILDGRTIGQRLYLLRRRRKLGLTGAQRLTGLEYEIIQRIELAALTPTLEQLCAFADAYDASLDEIVGRAR